MQLLARNSPKATVLTIGYHASLEAYHQRKLVPADRRQTPRPSRKRAWEWVSNLVKPGPRG